jgi:glycosyltransferase involved in cell wall biosynthesis
MKIVMLSADYLPNIGGIAAHIYHLSRALINSGVKVIVLNPVPGNKNELKKLESNGIINYQITYPFQKDRLRRIWDRTKATISAFRQIENDLGGIDILHQHDHMTSTIAAYLSKKRVRWVWTNHTSGFLHDYEKRFNKILMRQAYKHLRGVIAVSEELLEKSEELFSDSFPKIYIPNGVDTNLYNPDIDNLKNRQKYGIDERDFVVLCPRRMVEKNGVIYLAHGVNEIINRFPEIPWKFVFLGDDKAVNTENEYILQVKSVLLKAQQKGYVSYLGNLPMEQMPGVNALADIVVMPSLMEAVSLSALEAMASRKPLIATNVGGLPEIVHHEATGLLVPPRNSLELADAIIRLHQDKLLKEIISKNALEHARTNYGWNTIADRTLTFYENIKKR